MCIRDRTDSEKASALQEFFSSVYTVETNHDFELLPSHITTDHIPMDEVVVSKNSIEKKVARLKIDKSSNHQLHPRVLSEIRKVISYPLCLIYNKSLSCAENRKIRGLKFDTLYWRHLAAYRKI